MVVAFEPISVVEEFVYTTLSADEALVLLLGSADAIRPQFMPDEEPDLHVTHDFAGPDGRDTGTIPMGQAIAMLSLRWMIVAWSKGPSRQALRPVMKRIVVALGGLDMRGRQFVFVDSDEIGWDVTTRYEGPARVTPEAGATGVWQQVAGYFRIEIRQK